jgi:hypothetical protein
VDGNGRSGQTAPILDISTAAEAERARRASQNAAAVAKEVDAFELKKFPRPAGKGLEFSDAAKLPGNLPSYIAKTKPINRSVDATLEAIGYYTGKDDAYVAVLKKLQDAVRERTAAAQNITKVMVMEERKEGIRDTFILDRGAYDAPTKTKVTPDTPSSLPLLPADAPRNRLGLAQWIANKDNPLTARVTVNRFWQALFGTGLVKTAEDFGVQGERPVHMDLLDWLAADFVESGWDVKHLLRRIVMSQTYRQSSRVPADNTDPENRLLARGARHRLPSHTLRDQALAVSGLLSRKSGGPSVKPYQPDGIWEEASFGKISYKQQSGEALYRRSLYTFWRRIVGPTMFFDTSQRQTCAIKASRTNTPLHALVTLNEPTYVESARALAQRLMKSAKDDLSRLDRLYLLVLSRTPSMKEKQTLTLTLEQLRTQFITDEKSAEKLLSVGEFTRDKSLPATEHAAWASLCLMVLNLDEAVSKE